MIKIIKIVTAVALLLVVLAALYQLKQARDEAQLLRAQQAQSERQISDLEGWLASSSNELAELTAENSRLKANPNEMELLKLRGEVARLRPLQDDVISLQKMVEQSTAGLPAWKTNEIANAGRATPIDAIQTYIYSSQITNTAEIGNSIVGDDADPPSPEALQDFIKDESNHPTANNWVTDYKILSETWLGPDKVQVELNASGGSGTMGVSVPFTLRNINGEWKLVVFKVREVNPTFNHLAFWNEAAAR